MKLLALALAGLVLAGCSGEAEIDVDVDPSPTETAASPTPTDDDGGIELEADDNVFEETELTVAAGTEVEIEFKNRGTFPHNFAVYTSEGGDAIFQGKIVSGGTEQTYTFDAPEESGSYHFQCDVHPTQMKGTLVVT